MKREHNDEGNYISINYANNKHLWQFQLSDNPYGENKLMQINGSILTSIYFDSVKIDIDLIDNYNIKHKETNEAYLNLYFYTNGVKSKTTDLVLLINQESSSEFQLIEALSSFGVVTEQNFKIEKLVNFLKIDIKN